MCSHSHSDPLTIYKSTQMQTSGKYSFAGLPTVSLDMRLIAFPAPSHSPWFHSIQATDYYLVRPARRP